jgi:hypothetical protein
MTDPDAVDLAMREIQRSSIVPDSPFSLPEPFVDPVSESPESASEKPIEMEKPPTSKLEDLPSDEAIHLRWSLRDIRARRWKMSPIKGAHMEKLLELGLIEFQDEIPVLTDAGLSEIA